MRSMMELQVWENPQKFFVVAIFACLLYSCSGVQPCAEENLDYPELLRSSIANEMDRRNPHRGNSDWGSESWGWPHEARRFLSEDARGFPEPLHHTTVPALFVFGDSTVDVGNNNELRTLAHATFLPYGKNFDTHLPTGRFSDGRLSVDYIANALGLSQVPCFACGGNFSDGVNFASAGSGVLNDTGGIFGEYISLSKQIVNFQAVRELLGSRLGKKNALKLVSKSIFYISSGSNDFINNYLLPFGPHWQLTLEEFQKLVVEALTANIRALFKLGARKIVVVSLSPLGCLPSQLFKMGSVHGECITRLNNISVVYNRLLADSVHRLRRHLPGVKLVYNDAYKAFEHITDNAATYGIIHTNRSCCGDGPYGGMKSCFMWSNVCPDANDHMWWDEYHPTTGVYKLIAKMFWSGPMEVSSPWNVKTLSTL